MDHGMLHVQHLPNYPLRYTQDGDSFHFQPYSGHLDVKVSKCNIRESIGNGFHTLDRMYTMYTYPSYDRLLSCH